MVNLSLWSLFHITGQISNNKFEKADIDQEKKSKIEKPGFKQLVFQEREQY